jgi:hypothetical protein
MATFDVSFFLSVSVWEACAAGGLGHAAGGKRKDRATRGERIAREKIESLGKEPHCGRGKGAETLKVTGEKEKSNRPVT